MSTVNKKAPAETASASPTYAYTCAACMTARVGFPTAKALIEARMAALIAQVCRGGLNMNLPRENTERALMAEKACGTAAWANAEASYKAGGAAVIAEHRQSHMICPTCAEAHMRATFRSPTEAENGIIRVAQFIELTDTFQSWKKSPSGRGRTVGLELECNPTAKCILTMLARLVASPTVDHSLRGEYALELRSPVVNEYKLKQWLDATVNSSDWDAVIYFKCGLHCWIGVPDFSYFDLVQFLRYCVKNRSFFFEVVAPSRKPTVELQPSGAPTQIPTIRRALWNSLLASKGNLLLWLYGTKDPTHLRSPIDSKKSVMQTEKRANDRNARNYPYGAVSRYWWLNIHGFFRQKAVEIRLHQATNSGIKIFNWVRAWVRIADFISKAPKNYLDVPIQAVLGKELTTFFAARAKALAPLHAKYAMDGLAPPEEVLLHTRPPDRMRNPFGQARPINPQEEVARVVREAAVRERDRQGVDIELNLRDDPDELRDNEVVVAAPRPWDLGHQRVFLRQADGHGGWRVIEQVAAPDPGRMQDPLTVARN